VANRGQDGSTLDGQLESPPTRELKVGNKRGLKPRSLCSVIVLVILSFHQLIDGTNTKNHHGRLINELDANKDKGFKAC
jgi:hypothetical protein